MAADKQRLLEYDTREEELYCETVGDSRREQFRSVRSYQRVMTRESKLKKYTEVRGNR